MLLEMLVHQRLERGEGHVRAALLESREGVDPEQAEVQPQRLEGNGLVQGLQCQAERLVLIDDVLEPIVLPAQGIGRRQQRFAAQVSVLGQLDDIRGLALVEPEGKAGQQLLQVVRILFGPFVQESFHTHAGGAHPVDKVVVPADVILLRGLGKEDEGQHKCHQGDKDSFHRISILILRSLG